VVKFEARKAVLLYKTCKLRRVSFYYQITQYLCILEKMSYICEVEKQRSRLLRGRFFFGFSFLLLPYTRLMVLYGRMSWVFITCARVADRTFSNIL